MAQVIASLYPKRSWHFHFIPSGSTGQCLRQLSFNNKNFTGFTGLKYLQIPLGMHLWFVRILLPAWQATDTWLAFSNYSTGNPFLFLWLLREFSVVWIDLELEDLQATSIQKALVKYYLEVFYPSLILNFSDIRYLTYLKAN